MTMFQRASKAQAKLRLALCGTAGTGKTYSALAIATELVPGGRIAVIDTERGSASLYADRFAFDVLNLETHSPDAYVEAIHGAEAEGYDVVVIDSLSHAWAGRDGALEQVDKAAKRSSSGNTFTAWRDVTPKHNRLIDAIIASSCHVIATMRTKTEWVLDKDEKTGKTTPRRVGMEPVMRAGVEYEFSVVGDINLDHQLVITKTRCSVLTDAVIDKPGAQVAKTLREWLTNGVAVPVESRPRVPADDPKTDDDVFSSYLAAIASAADQAALDKAATGAGKPAKGTAQHRTATEAYKTRKAQLANGARS
jgi:hypothetical protein